MKTEIEQEICKLKKRYNNKKIKLHKEYWLSEWSYDPLYEGYDTYKGVITGVKEVNGYMVYTTDKNCREYFAWDIHTSMYEAEKISDLKNIYLYDWCEHAEDSLLK